MPTPITTDHIITDESHLWQGQMAFMFSALFYVRSAPHIKALLKAKNLNIRLALVNPEFPNYCCLHFHGDQIRIEPLSLAEAQNPKEWDAKLTMTAPTMVQYFLGELGIVRPILKGIIRVSGLFTVLKLIWFVKECNAFYSANASFSWAVFYRFYNQRKQGP